MKAKIRKRTAVVAFLFVCIVLCTTIACKVINEYPFNVTVEIDLGGGTYDGKSATELELVTTGSPFEKLKIAANSPFRSFDYSLLKRNTANGEQEDVAIISSVAGISFDEWIKTGTYPRQSVRFVAEWYYPRINFTVPKPETVDLKNVGMSIKYENYKVSETIEFIIDDPNIKIENIQKDSIFLKPISLKESVQPVVTVTAKGKTDGKIYGTCSFCPNYRYFVGNGGKTYQFELVKEFHFEEKDYPTGMNRTTMNNKNQPSWASDSLVTITGVDDQTATNAGTNGMDIKLGQGDIPAVGTFDYIEFRFKDTGNSRIGWNPNNGSWVYADGKFEYINTNGLMELPTISSSTDKQISTTYNSNNNEYVSFGIWNGTSGEDASSSLLMEYVYDNGAYKTVLHEVNNNSGTENVSSAAGRGDGLIQLLVQPSKDAVVSIDYLAFYKKVSKNVTITPQKSNYDFYEEGLTLNVQYENISAGEVDIKVTGIEQKGYSKTDNSIIFSAPKTTPVQVAPVITVEVVDKASKVVYYTYSFSPNYRYFDGANNKKYQFELVKEFHFEGNNLTAPLARGSTSSDVTLNYNTNHILEFTLTGSGQRNAANSLVMYNGSVSDIPDFDYVEYRFKDTGNAGIAYATNSQAWIYTNGKFKTQEATFPSYFIPPITENNQISTTYNANNNEYVSFGIWNGTSGEDANSSLLMEYVYDGGAYKTVLHEVNNNSGTENLKATTDYLRFMVRPSDNSKVEVDYISLFKKIN